MGENSEIAPVADNLIQPFQMAEAGVRGRVVRMGSVLDSILKRHNYPDTVAQLLGEGLVLAAILGGALKFDGIFTVQTKSDGPIGMIAADLTTPGSMRGYAAFNEEMLAQAEKEGGEASIKKYLGNGYTAFTIDSADTGQRYQGIVDLEGDSLQSCMENYFARSEQLETRLHVSVEKKNGNWRAGGLMIQRLPEESLSELKQEQADEGWRSAEALAATVKPEELTHPHLRASELLYRLFHEDGVWLYDVSELEDKCSCSPERVMKTLVSFSRENLEEMADDGKIGVDCQFCSAHYVFGVDDVEAARS